MLDLIFNPDAMMTLLMHGAVKTAVSSLAIMGTGAALYMCYKSLSEMNAEYKSSKEELQRMTSKEGL